MNYNNSSVDRNLNHPIWLDSQKCTNYTSTSKMNYTRYPNRKLTPAATSIRLRRNENNYYTISDHQRTPSAPNIRYDLPVCCQGDKQDFRRPRLLIRRKDSIQPAPSYILSEDKSLYKSTFTGQIGPRPSRIQPCEQGINGLETAQQRIKNLLKNQDLTNINEELYKKMYPLPNNSTYNIDFKEHIFQDTHSENTLPNINFKMQDNSTDYRENYHSWIKPPRNEEIMQRIGYNWKPTPAVYLPEDPSKHEPIESSSVYRSNFIDFSKERLTTSMKPSQKACYSAIKADKLLNSFDGRQERIPKTLYRDSFTGLHNVDNWSDRHILQNQSSITSRTGRFQQNDDTYWFGIDVAPFRDTKETMFTESCYMENPYEKSKA
ncbi:unnamed protein product [Schistosoma turkestanicum]|nr:unnamed protein product [Schistosoma turkestanicum]